MRERPTIEALDAIEVGTSSGRQIPLREISTPHFETVTNSITRYNRERQVTVSANTRPDFNTARVTADVVKRLGEIGLPPGYRFVIAGDAEAQQESFSGLLPAILVAVFGILAVLVLEFGSFRSTAIVAGVIPLGLTGALLALLATGYNLSFTSIIGMIALIGIEIKNSILLVDFTNQLRERGTPLDQAIQEAGEVRFLPILLTSATAIGGLTPAGSTGLRALLAARDRHHRRIDLIDAARALGDTGDVQAVATLGAVHRVRPALRAHLDRPDYVRAMCRLRDAAQPPHGGLPSRCRSI